MSPQKLRLKSTLQKQEAKQAKKKKIRPRVIKDFLGRELGNFTQQATKKINKISIKMLKKSCLEVM
jgi:hypothetical protein